MYDFETAKVMLKSKRFLYVGFMCHQAIEKILKADYIKVKREIPPYTHKLVKLAEENGLYEIMTDEQKDFLDIISPLNIEARYPTQKQDIFETLNMEKCKNIVNKTEEMILWIKTKLEN